MTLTQIARQRRIRAMMKKQARETLRNLRHQRAKVAITKESPLFSSVRSRTLEMAEGA